MKSMTRNGLRQNIPQNSKGCLIQVSLIYFALLDSIVQEENEKRNGPEKIF